MLMSPSCCLLSVVLSRSWVAVQVDSSKWNVLLVARRLNFIVMALFSLQDEAS